jgi:hypothetical protein
MECGVVIARRLAIIDPIPRLDNPENLTAEIQIGGTKSEVVPTTSNLCIQVLDTRHSYILDSTRGPLDLHDLRASRYPAPYPLLVPKTLLCENFELQADAKSCRTLTVVAKQNVRNQKHTSEPRFKM